MEEAVVNGEVRGELMRRETGKEAEMAVRVYVKEALERMGPSSLELEAMAALQAGRVGEYCGKGEDFLFIFCVLGEYDGSFKLDD